MIFNNLPELAKAIPNKGRLMGLDLGTKTIGVAISDGEWLLSNPKLTISRKGGKTDFLVIKKIIEENKIQGIILGMPFNMDGSESKMSELVRKFADGLDVFLPDAKIGFFDERLSSFLAEELMQENAVKHNKRKGLIDQIAASIILEGALSQIK